MGKFPVVSLVIAIIALVGSVQFSREMNRMRMDMYKNLPERTSRVYTPVLGIDKFYAGISWVKLIQDMGDPKVKMEKNEAGEYAADFFYSQLDRITTLDPDATVVYSLGARHISHIRPKLAIALLNKGNNLSTLPDWQRFHLCSFIEDQYIRSGLTDTKSAEYIESLDNSIAYLEKAMEAGEVPSYIETAFLRKQAKKGGYEDDPLLFLKAEVDYYFARQKELKGVNMPTQSEIPPAPGAEGTEASLAAMDIDNFAMAEDSRLFKTKERIINKAQSLAIEQWQLAQEAIKKKDEAAAATHMNTHKDIADIFKKVNPSATNYSPVSLLSYGPGEFYDVASGTPVIPYGLSFKAYMENKGIVLFKGEYCHVTGMSQTESKVKWEEWAKEHGIK